MKMEKFLTKGEISSIDIYFQIPGITTAKILEKKLYSLKDRKRILEIIQTIRLKKKRKIIQCKASNYVIFNMNDGSALETDIDVEGNWMRINTLKDIEFYEIKNDTANLLLEHIKKAKTIYEKHFETGNHKNQGSLSPNRM